MATSSEIPANISPSDETAPAAIVTTRDERITTRSYPAEQIENWWVEAAAGQPGLSRPNRSTLLRRYISDLCDGRRTTVSVTVWDNPWGTGRVLVGLYFLAAAWPGNLWSSCTGPASRDTNERVTLIFTGEELTSAELRSEQPLPA